MKNKFLQISTVILLGFVQLQAQTNNTFTDSRDGKVYKTVTIGNQMWMAQNLAYKADGGCWVYNDKNEYVSQYGYLYDYETAKTTCPMGWHLPDKQEYETMLIAIKGTSYEILIDGGSSGFSAQFAGMRTTGGFSEMDNIAYFWSATASSGDFAWGLRIEDFAYTIDFHKRLGLSVRCIKD